VSSSEESCGNSKFEGTLVSLRAVTATRIDAIKYPTSVEIKVAAQVVWKIIQKNMRDDPSSPRFLLVFPTKQFAL
jgi:hypothetical protein